MEWKELLLKTTDGARANRARKIKDEELIINKISVKEIKAEIRSYSIKIDLDRRILSHDCQDWLKGLGIKRICKHVGKLFLQLPTEKSTNILTDLIEQKDKWQFQASATSDDG